MSYAILRTVKVTDVNQTLSHNLRTNFIGSNVDRRRSHKNKILLDELGFSSTKGKSSESILLDYYQSKNVKIRKNSVQAMEFLLSASPEFFENSTDDVKRNWVKTQLEFAKNEWGDNLKFAVLHVDETTPHIHLVVSTEETKIHTYKNKHGSFQKEKTSLNASRFNPEYLRDLQTKYAKSNEKFGLKRGIEGSKATHVELKEFRRNLAKMNRKNEITAEKLHKKIINELESNKNFVGVLTPTKAISIISPIINSIFKRYNLLKFTNSEIKKIKEENIKLEDTVKDLSDKVATLTEQNRRFFNERNNIEDDFFALKSKLETVENELNEMLNEQNKKNQAKSRQDFSKMKPI